MAIPDNEASNSEAIERFDKAMLFHAIRQLTSRVDELETVNAQKINELYLRVQELEQFQREYETAQEYERDRSL